ncbi:MAG TPA: hypothetical protein VKK81_16590, partial [Candidatus Binatia bacterium]|nr:hypothetical protein [Candidatus Binatia bacterium]
MGLTSEADAKPSQLISVESLKSREQGSSCSISKPRDLKVTGRYRWRMISLAAVHVYIALHIILWHVFDIKIWGKTAMMGV